jgi:Tfp pilus assembly protein PilF
MWEEARCDFESAIRVDPQLPVAYTNAGIAYLSLGQVDRAITSLEKAVELEPENQVALTKLAAAYASSDGSSPAAEILAKVATSNSE